MRNPRRRTPLTAALLLALLLGHLSPAAAQQQATRADEYTQAQDKKAAAPAAPLTSRAERIAALIERVGEPPQGFFPFIGNIYPGSWLALGPGYRKPFNSGAVVIAKAAWSATNFKTADVLVHTPHIAGERLRLQLDAGWLDAPRLYYYGRGNDSGRGDRMKFGLRPSGGHAAVQFTPVKAVRIDAGWGVEKYEAEPKGGAPLSGSNLTLGTTTVSGQVDWRRSPGWSNSGGMVRVTWKGRRGIAGDEVSFNEYEGEASQLFPILRGNWVIALHGLATGTDASRGEVPFFLLPSVGGPTSRGLVNFRFRDRHRLATAAELRWSAAQFMDLALFVDAARVAATRRELDFDDLHTSYGIGARFHTLYSTVFRAELARSREGLRFVVGGGPVF